MERSELEPAPEAELAEVEDGGGLRLPFGIRARLIPRTRYRVEVRDDELIFRRASAGGSLASGEDRVAALRRLFDEIQTRGPKSRGEDYSRERIYD